MLQAIAKQREKKIVIADMPGKNFLLNRITNAEGCDATAVE
jgi:hypothetical protein